MARVIKLHFSGTQPFLVQPGAYPGLMLGPSEPVYVVSQVPEVITDSDFLEIIRLWVQNGGGFPGGCPVTWDQIVEELKIFGWEVTFGT